MDVDASAISHPIHVYSTESKPCDGVRHRCRSRCGTVDQAFRRLAGRTTYGWPQPTGKIRANLNKFVRWTLRDLKRGHLSAETDLTKGVPCPRNRSPERRRISSSTEQAPMAIP